MGRLFGIPVNGKRGRFAENVFSGFRDDRIGVVWSVIDKAAVASQSQENGIAFGSGQAT
ncbi:ester cyclase [Azospirillum thiophilum]|uniref:ester cyclase n=1 Tax=Azospirillum thiophilum TaxID=528244 RepID=UPI0009E26091|nr:ester cyclase [Azospirillum thiophilum]